TLSVSADYTASFSGPAGMSVTVTPSSFTIPAGETQVLTIEADVSALTAGEFAFGSITLSTDAVWPDPNASGPAPMATLLSESFSDETFPPAGWTAYNVDGGGEQWARTTLSFNSSPASARHRFGSSGYDEEGWLVTPPLALDSGVSTLTFAERTEWPSWYYYQGVWVSTDSCNPADGDFVELAEVEGTNDWRTVNYDLSAYAGETICIAFVYEGDDGTTWYIDDVVVTSLSASTVLVADTNIPVVVIPVQAQPVITVDPDELNASQTPNTQTTQTLTIGNAGGVELEWEFTDGLIPTTLIVWDQPQNGTSGIVSDFFIGSDAGAYSASDFVLSELTEISYIFAAGFDNSNTLSAQPAINWAIYADDGGVPAGHPEDGTDMASALWAYSAPVNGPGVDITNNDIALDLLAAGEALALGAGTYWLTVYPSYNVTGAGGARWNWYQAAQVGAQTQLVSPAIFNIADWTSLGALGISFTDTAFRIEAPGVIACEDPGDLPWLSVFPTQGPTDPLGETVVDVTFDSTGLVPGDYAAFLCIESNDPDNPFIPLPVTLEVQALPTIEVDIDQIEATQLPGAQTTHTMVISNTGEADLNWYIEEAEGVMAGPVPAAVRNLPVGADRATPTTLSAMAPASILPTGVGVINGSWSEGFDDITLLPGLGWALINNSDPVGTTGWFQGNPATFPAHTGATNSYIGANFNNTTGNNTISNWLLTPEITFRNGDSFSFWTSTGSGSTWPDRLEVRWSGNGSSVDVGATATSVGDFDTLLLSVNPGLTVGGYPEAWTQYTVEISGLTGPTNGRLAFRYFVTNGGPSGSNSNYIGIDTFEYTSAAPTVLHDNGPFITSFGDGPGGSDVSLLQNVSLGMTTLGAGVQFVSPGPHNRIADEFEVTTPGGWTIENIVFYGYQTNSTTSSSFTGVNFRIWDGPPTDAGSSVIFGDTTTNRFADTGWTGSYRYAETAIGNTQRPIMYVIGEAGIHLEPGSYWVDWQLAGTIASGPWQPPITIIGQTTTGNALQFFATGWEPWLDGATLTPQGAPFQLWGSTVCSSPSDVSWISVDPTSGLTAAGDTSEIEVTLDSTGVPPGDYVAYLCLHSDDPNNPVIVLPVTMQVPPPPELTGTVTLDGAGLAGVTIAGLPGPPVTDADGNYSVQVDYGFSGTATPQLAGHSFDPPSRSYSDVNVSLDNQDYVATLNTYTLSGTVTLDGVGLGGVSISGLPGSPVTAADGSYSAVVQHGFSGIATPELAGHTFDPPSRSYSDVTASIGDQNYAATLNSYTLSGTITLGGAGLGGVTVVGLPGPPVTAADGSYSVLVEHGFSGTATPELAGHNFDPVSRSYSNVTGSVVGEDYLAARNVWTVTVTVDPLQAGSVSGAGEYANGDSVTLTATANPGWVFLGWTEAGEIVSTATTLSFTIDDDRAFVAGFGFAPVPVPVGGRPGLLLLVLLSLLAGLAVLAGQRPRASARLI
ncbi:MAG: hypothetical protein EA370_15885, partial [Wenzhouxiangella sp.]